MLKRIYRLPSRRINSARSFATPLFLLKVSKNNLSFSRFGFVVSKKIDKRATGRNKIKRMLRSVIEKNISQIEVGNDILFIAKPGILESNFETTESFVLKLLKEKGYTK